MPRRRLDLMPPHRKAFDFRELDSDLRQVLLYPRCVDVSLQFVEEEWDKRVQIQSTCGSLVPTERLQRAADYDVEQLRMGDEAAHAYERTGRWPYVDIRVGFTHGLPFAK